MTTPTHRPARSSGFTLTEILVAIGIIVILIALLVPMVSRVRRSAQRADVQQQISSLGAAIERYHADFRAYPGPLSNDQIAETGAPPEIYLADGTTPFPDSDKITMSENLVLGLLGGLRRGIPSGGNPGVLIYDFNAVGQGPGQLNPRQPKKFAAYAEPIQLSWADSQPSSGAIPNAPGIPSGYYVDDASLSRAVTRADSPIPEFVDRFTNPMPILYLRARTAAKGVISDDYGVGSEYQYDLTQIAGYTRPTNNESIGVGKSLSKGEYVPPLAANQPLRHGLITVEETMTLKKEDRAAGNSHYPYDAFPYFQDPTIRPTNPAQPNVSGTPRKKNGYILISAGPDRVYGTVDDITSFGDVAP